MAAVIILPLLMRDKPFGYRHQCAEVYRNFFLAIGGKERVHGVISRYWSFDTASAIEFWFFH